jgi:hypothetical protein
LNVQKFEDKLGGIVGAILDFIRQCQDEVMDKFGFFVGDLGHGITFRM